MAFQPTGRVIEQTDLQTVTGRGAFPKPKAMKGVKERSIKLEQELGAFATEVSGAGVAGIGKTGAFLLDPFGTKREKGLISLSGPIERTSEEFEQMASRRGREAFPDASEISRAGGKVIGSLASMIPAMGGAGSLTRGLKTLPFLQKMRSSGGVMRAISSLGSEAAGGSLGTVGAVASMEGRAPTFDEIKTGALIDVFTLGAGKLFKKLTPSLFRLGLNPRGLNYKRIEQNARDAVKLNLTGTKRQIIDKSNKLIKTSGGQLDDAVKGYKKKITRTQLANSAVERATELEKMGDVQGAKQIMKYVDDFRKGKEILTAVDILDLKRFAREKVLPQLKKGTFGNLNTAAKKQFWEEVYHNADDFIDSIPKAKELNRKMEVAYSVRDVSGDILKKAPQVPAFGATLEKLPIATPAFTKLAKGSKQLSKMMTNPVVRQALKMLGVDTTVGELEKFVPTGAVID